MSAIPHIQEGMLWSDAISIINQVIDKTNELDAAMGGALVNGQFDYSALANKPSINGIELNGNQTQRDLSISIDSVTQQSLNTLAARCDDLETALGGKLDSEDLPTELEPYARTTDIPDISNLATKTELSNGLAGKVDNSTRTSDLVNINTAMSAKINSGEAYTKAQIDTLMTSKMGVREAYTTAQVDALLTSKASTNDVYTKAQTDTLLTGKMGTSEAYTKSQTDTILSQKVNTADCYTKAQLDNIVTQMNTAVSQADAKATAASNSATAASTSASEASASAQSVSGAMTRISALETTVNGNQQITGLTVRTTKLETKLGNVPENVNVTTDLKETREKSNEMISKLKEIPELAPVMETIQELVIAV